MVRTAKYTIQSTTSILSKQILNKIHKELRYVEQNAFLKEINNQKLWNFELCSRESMKDPVWIIKGFQQQDGQDSQNLNNDSFCRLPVTGDRCIIGTEKYPDGGILLSYDDVDYAQGYSQIKEALRAPTKNNILTPFISDDNFKSSIVRADDVGYILYVFDIRYQQNVTASKPIKVKFEFEKVVPNDINGYALVLSNKLVSVSSHGQRHFDLI